MLTKQQVFDAALKYAQDQNPGVSKAAIIPDGDFIEGARWAAEQMQAENDLLKKDNLRLFEQAAALQAENGVLRALLESWVKGVSDPHADGKLYYLYSETLKALK